MTSITDSMRQLQLQFCEQLTDKLNTIRSQYQSLDLADWRLSEVKDLHLKIHNLTGSAGTFGMLAVSDAARKVEKQLTSVLKTGEVPNEDMWQTIAEDLNNLEQISRIQINNFTPTPTPLPLNKLSSQSPLIYIVGDEPELIVFWGQYLREAGYKTRLFPETDKLRNALTSTNTQHPDAVVMDVNFSDSNNADTLSIKELNLGNESDIPVLVISERDDLEGRLIALRAGASRYLKKPVNKERLVESLDVITDRQPNKPYRVLMIDDDPVLLQAQAAVLSSTGMTVQTLSDPLLTIETVENFNPDVIVLDIYMPGASGPELAAILRERDTQMRTPILFLSSETNVSAQLLALNLAGDDCLVKPVQPDHLIASVRARARRARQINTVRRRLETTLYEREREHLAVDQHAIISIADQAGFITYINKKFCDVSGYSADELIGQNHRIVKSDIHPPEFYQDLWQTISSGNVWQGEICNLRKNGEMYWVESTITPFLDNEGNPYQYISIRTEITHVKQAELDLLESRENLRATLESTMDGILAVTSKGQINFVNQQFLKMWKVPGTLETQGNFEGFLEHAGSLLIDPDAFITKTEELTSSSSDSYDILEFHDGRLFEQHSKPLMQNGIPAGRVWSFRDFTERKRAELSLVTARDEAERANLAKSEFLSSMSHELRTPMNAILGFGQLMETDEDMTDELTENVQEILKAGHHLLKLINEVLDLSKIESGYNEMSLEPVEIDPLVEECLNLIKTLADKRDIDLSHKGLTGAVVTADSTRLKQVLLNLLSNAIKYNCEGGSVKLDVRGTGEDQLRIRITDTGSGIPEDSLEEIFQPFNRLDAKNSTIEGTGIGLTLSRRIIELMGGTVDVQSEIGIGSSFWIDLPLDSLDKIALGTVQPTDNNSLPKQADISEKNIVLYIEDNPANLKLVEQILSRRKHIHLITSHTPELGIELARTRQPKLILLDINMPGMDGYQVMEAFRNDTTLKNIPVVAITANAMPRDIKRAMAAGFIDYLTKPLDLVKLYGTIDKILHSGNQRMNTKDD